MWPLCLVFMWALATELRTSGLHSKHCTPGPPLSSGVEMGTVQWLERLLSAQFHEHIQSSQQCMLPCAFCRLKDWNNLSNVTHMGWCVNLNSQCKPESCSQICAILINKAQPLLFCHCLSFHCSLLNLESTKETDFCFLSYFKISPKTLEHRWKREEIRFSFSPANVSLGFFLVVTVCKPTIHHVNHFILLLPFNIQYQIVLFSSQMFLPDSNYWPGPADCSWLGTLCSETSYFCVVAVGDRSINNTEYISLHLKIFMLKLPLG